MNDKKGTGPFVGVTSQKELIGPVPFFRVPFFRVGDKVRLDHLVLTNGSDFFCYFKSLQGNVVNKKNQIRLPTGFFDEAPSPE